MGDIFGRIVSFLFGAVMLFIVPVTLVAIKQDDLKQTTMDDAVVEFVDNARASGQITDDAYRDLVRKITAAQELCDIRIDYRAAYVAPKTDYTGALPGTPGEAKETEVYLKAYNKTDIVHEIYDSQVKCLNCNNVYKSSLTNCPKCGVSNDAATSHTHSTRTAEPFILREGGYINVEVNNTTPTLGSKMIRLFLPMYAGRALHTSYGGYVGNTRR